MFNLMPCKRRVKPEVNPSEALEKVDQLRGLDRPEHRGISLGPSKLRMSKGNPQTKLSFLLLVLPGSY